MNRAIRLWLGLIPVLLGLIAVCTWVAATGKHDPDSTAIAVALPAIALSFVISGLIAWTQQPDNGTGRLLVLVGALWASTGLFESDNGWVLGSVGLFGSLFLAGFVHLLLAFPEGRLGTRQERRLIAGLWVVAFLAGALPNLFEKRFTDCGNCPDNPVLIADNHGAANVLEAIFTVVGAVIFITVMALIVRRWRGATRAQRRILGPVYLSGGITIALVATLFTVGSFSNTAQNILGVIAFVTFGMVPLFFLAGLLRTRLYRAAARLLREVPDDPTPEEIQAGFRRVLGDPTLVFLTWVDEAGSYVDTEGNRCQLTPVAPKRAVTAIAYEDIKLGAIVHDKALHHQQALVDEVVSAARLAMMKDRGLQALQLSEARSRALLDAIPDLMFRMARDGTYLEAAGRRESLIRPREELIGRSVGELLPREVADRFEAALARPASVGVQTIEYRLDINGEGRDFEARIVPAGNDEMMVIVRDFTERTQLEEELSRASRPCSASRRSRGPSSTSRP